MFQVFVRDCSCSRCSRRLVFSFDSPKDKLGPTQTCNRIWLLVCFSIAAFRDTFRTVLNILNILKVLLDIKAPPFTPCSARKKRNCSRSPRFFCLVVGIYYSYLFFCVNKNVRFKLWLCDVRIADGV